MQGQMCTKLTNMEIQGPAHFAGFCSNNPIRGGHSDPYPLDSTDFATLLTHSARS